MCSPALGCMPSGAPTACPGYMGYPTRKLLWPIDDNLTHGKVGMSRLDNRLLPMTLLIALSWRFLLRLGLGRARCISWGVAPNPANWALE